MFRMMPIVLVLGLMGVCSLSSAQEPLPSHVRAFLDTLGAELLFPLDGGYKAVPLPRSPGFFPAHYLLRSSSEKLEIRYVFQPDTSAQTPPHLEARRLALHLCSNDENAVITARDLTDMEREELFNADWGKVHLFPPKQEFGDGAPFCQMLSIYKEGRGMIHLFIIFEAPSPLIENRLYLVRFL